MSKPGKLPCCAVIHAVAPKWSEDAGAQKQAERFLKQTCEEALKSASKRNFKSLSIPAISTGIYGYPQDSAAKIIIEAVLKFFKGNPQSTLKTVHLVQDTKNVFATSFLKKYRGSPGFVDCSQSGHNTDPVPQEAPKSGGTVHITQQPQVKGAPRTIAVNRCKIVLEEANIANVKVMKISRK